MNQTPDEESDADAHDLQRFVDAQEPTISQVRSELKAGEKRSHWMWFIFPQMRGLGSSLIARRFAIADLKEAEAYLDHPVLGTRLRECTLFVNVLSQRSVSEIFGYPDDMKFHSSMTLFAQAATRSGPENDVFSEAIAKYFAGRVDTATVSLLNPRR